MSRKNEKKAILLKFSVEEYEKVLEYASSDTSTHMRKSGKANVSAFIRKQALGAEPVQRILERELRKMTYSFRRMEGLLQQMEKRAEIGISTREEMKKLQDMMKTTGGKLSSLERCVYNFRVISSNQEKTIVQQCD